MGRRKFFRRRVEGGGRTGSFGSGWLEQRPAFGKGKTTCQNCLIFTSSPSNSHPRTPACSSTPMSVPPTPSTPPPSPTPSPGRAHHRRLRGTQPRARRHGSSSASPGCAPAPAARRCSTSVPAESAASSSAPGTAATTRGLGLTRGCHLSALANPPRRQHRPPRR